MCLYEESRGRLKPLHLLCVRFLDDVTKRVVFSLVKLSILVGKLQVHLDHAKPVPEVFLLFNLFLDSFSRDPLLLGVVGIHLRGCPRGCPDNSGITSACAVARAVARTIQESPAPARLWRLERQRTRPRRR